ncbi:MAG: hypothetical protein LBO67_08875 [Spirochaetaceae bacterium]|nr:hypothetical protein [Spirochaetaceae bacterium]
MPIHLVYQGHREIFLAQLVPGEQAEKIPNTGSNLSIPRSLLDIPLDNTISEIILLSLLRFKC